MSTSVKFWDKIAEKYSKRPVGDEAAYRKKLDVTQSYLRPDMEVLEFGCGTGTTALIHAPFVKHIRATDVSQAMLAIARDKAKAAGITNVTFEQSTIEALEAAENSLDIVMGHSILHLLEDKEAAIAKVRGILKPGGLFVSSTVCMGETMSWFKPFAAIGHFFGFIPMVKFFTAQALADSLTSAGFEIDYQWQPGKGKAVFIVARKTA